MRFSCCSGRGYSLRSLYRFRSSLCRLFCAGGSGPGRGRRRQLRLPGSGCQKHSWINSHHHEQKIISLLREHGLRTHRGVTVVTLAHRAQYDQGFPPAQGCRPFSADKEPLALYPSASNPWTFGQKIKPIRRMIRAASQAMAHCQSTTPRAHLRPISRRMAAMAATQGV